MAKAQFQLEAVGDISVLTLALDNFLHEENEKLMASIDGLLNEGHKKIILDLSSTAYVSSLILASLVYIQKKAKETGGDLVFCEVKNRVLDVIKMTNLDKVFTIAPTRPEALNRFK